MVLKPQLQELLSKQFLKRPWESTIKKRDLMLAVVWITSDSLFLTDGILVIQTKPQPNLKAKLQKETGFDLNLADLEGFVCLFENCRINITDGESFLRPKEGDLAKLFRKKDFRSDIKRGDCDSNGKGKLTNLEKGEMKGRQLGFEMVNRTVINVEEKKKKRVKKKISKKKKGRRKRMQSVSTEDSESLRKMDHDDVVNPIINFQMDFDQFSIICPFGKHFLSGKREMVVDSLSYEQMQFFERKYKLEKHIKKMKNPEDQSMVPVLELGDIMDIQCSGKVKKIRTSKREENKTRTSTPKGDLEEQEQISKKRNNFQSKKKRTKRKRRS
jgi:hypothetical protein